MPSSRQKEGGKRVRVDPDAYRAALAAYLNLDLQAVGQVGAAARSDARAKEMLDQIEEHVFVADELPRRKAKDAKEAELAKWMDNVSTGHTKLSDELRARSASRSPQNN